jgi:adenylate cyclase
MAEGTQARELGTSPTDAAGEASYTTAELARLSATTRDHVERLVRIGVLRPTEPDRFTSADLQRVRIVAAYVAGGIALDDLAMAIDERRMSFEFADRIYPQPSPPSGRTVGDLAEDLGTDGDLLPDLFLALGLARPTPDRPLTEADAARLPAFLAAWSRGPHSRDTVLRAARLLGEATRRVADGWVRLFEDAIAPPPHEAVSLTVDELRPRMLEPAAEIAGLLEPTTVWLLRRHMEQALDAVNVETMERALELRGIRARVEAEPPAIVFADLSGFTRLTEQHGDEVAVGFAARLADVALDVAARHRGRLVKQLGDGVMLVFNGRRSAVDAAFALLTLAARADLPPLHVGISAGPVIERDGDFFGRTVNRASRLSGVAGPGEVVVDGAVVDTLDGWRVVELGPIEIKGVPDPVTLFRLEPSDR